MCGRAGSIAGSVFFVLPGIESRLLSADLTAMQEMKLKLAKTDITLTKNEEAKEE